MHQPRLPRKRGDSRKGAIMATIYGTVFSDVIDASDGVTNGADVIYAYRGADDIFALGGNDILAGTGAGGTAQGDTLTSIENLIDRSSATISAATTMPMCCRAASAPTRSPAMAAPTGWSAAAASMA